jgi:hypothetical protein
VKRCTDADTGINALPWLLIDDAKVAKARRAPSALRLRPGTATFAPSAGQSFCTIEPFRLCKDDIPARLR